MFMTVFLLEFQSWYWTGRFDDPELQGAFDAMNEPTTSQAFGQGFLTLLRSDDTVARGIALDFYDRAEMTSRFVGGNPFEDHGEEVVRVARELLRQPPRPVDERTRIEGANHASALAALWRLGLEDGDADAIAAVLERMPDVELRERALDAARVLLEDPETPDERLSALVARVEECHERVQAVRALRDSQEAAATERLVLATEDDEWRVRQEAAAALSSGRRFYAHRPLLERLAGTWSDDERSDAADEVRSALREGPHSFHWEGVELEGELGQAHREMRSPSGEEAHRSAFCTLLRSRRPEAVGIALDHYHLADGLTRFGIDDGEYAAEVLAIARDVLGRPSSAAGADHASAFGILSELGEPEDAETIAAALRRREAPAVVRESAVDAAWECLERWDTPDEGIVTALEGLVFDGSGDMELRVQAVNALTGLGPVEQVTAVLRRAARSGDLPVQVEAAVGLTFPDLIEEHRELVREVAGSWPQDAGERAAIVRRKLAD
ncbi:hypothetical protein [Actinomadura kijaniata]|uniref:hypothetical protein n=1 Tax=Actinomadura kijaniata TaxID=46161 RepID=UPI00082D655F|nr:hypothetical protein [Actinomadura kijaniata]